MVATPIKLEKLTVLHMLQHHRMPHTPIEEPLLWLAVPSVWL